MFSKRLLSALNEQVKNELYSAYLYLGMAAYLEGENLPGMARWMRVQSREEVGHAMKLFDFIVERGGKVELAALERPATQYDSPAAAFAAALEHEQKVTAMIHHLYALALEEQDYPTQVMLHWFIEEQVEEEANVGRTAEMVAAAGGQRWALLLLDEKLAERQE